MTHRRGFGKDRSWRLCWLYRMNCAAWRRCTHKIAARFSRGYHREEKDFVFLLEIRLVSPAAIIAKVVWRLYDFSCKDQKGDERRRGVKFIYRLYLVVHLNLRLIQKMIFFQNFDYLHRFIRFHSHAFYKQVMRKSTSALSLI